MKISVVVPVYGCKGALIELYERIKNTVKEIGDSYEIVFVDDNCPQNSWELIQEICKNDLNVKGVRLSRNWGQMCAIAAGLDVCNGDNVVVMDCDLQDSPEDIKKLYDKKKEGYDIVFSRREKRIDNKIKIFLSNCFYKIYSVLCGDNYDPAMSNYCIMDRKVVDSFCKMKELHRAFTIYLKWLGFKQTIINVNHSDRKEGKTSYSMKKRIKLATDIILSQSDRILKMIVKLGMVISMFSFVYAIVLFVRYFIYDIASGWTSIIVTLFMMCGILLVAIGCVGIYVGNIFMQTKNRPLYVIDKILNEKGE